MNKKSGKVIIISNIQCPVCKNPLRFNTSSYFCTRCSFKVYREIAGKKLSDDIIRDLCSNQRTGFFNGFISNKGKRFQAALLIKDGKVVFEYPDKPDQNNQSLNHAKIERNKDTAVVRVESSSPGTVFVSISGPVQYNCVLGFGLHPTRLTECLGVICATKYLIHCEHKAKLVISANNREFVQYTLREITPSKKEARYLIEYMWKLLGEFETWEISYVHKKNSSLHGGVKGGTFPKGVFPWLQAYTEKRDEKMYIQLPDYPEVQYQFEASIRTAIKEDGLYVVPERASKVVVAWLATVKSTN